MKPRPFLQAILVPRLRPAFVQRKYVQLLSNDTWFRVVNRRYIRAWSDAAGAPPLSEVGKRVVRDLRTNGVAFAHIDEFFGDDTFARMQRHFAELLAQSEARGAASKSGSKPYIVRLGGDCKLENGDVVTRIVTHPELASIAGHYMGMVPRFSSTRLWHTVPTEGEERIASQQWHRDYNDLKFTKIFLYLNDVDERSGPLEYIAGTHRDGPHGHVLEDCLDESGRRDYVKDHQMAPYGARLNPHKTACVGRAGTLSFVDTYGFHRGGKCIDRCRDVFIIQFTTNANTMRPQYSIADDFNELDSDFMRMVFGLQ